MEKNITILIAIFRINLISLLGFSLRGCIILISDSSDIGTSSNDQNDLIARIITTQTALSKAAEEDNKTPTEPPVLEITLPQIKNLNILTFYLFNPLNYMCYELICTHSFFCHSVYCTANDLL